MNKERIYLWVYDFKKQELKFFNDGHIYESEYDNKQKQTRISFNVDENSGRYKCDRAVSSEEFTPYRLKQCISVWGHRKDDILVLNLLNSATVKYIDEKLSDIEKEFDSLVELNEKSHSFLMSSCSILKELTNLNEVTNG